MTVRHRYTLRGKIGCRTVSVEEIEAKALLMFGVYALFCVLGWCLMAVLVAVVWS
jgi:hypothetical protein